MLQTDIKKTGTGSDSSTQTAAHSQPYNKPKGQRKRTEIKLRGKFSPAVIGWVFNKELDGSFQAQATGDSIWFLFQNSARMWNTFTFSKTIFRYSVFITDRWKYWTFAFIACETAPDKLPEISKFELILCQMFLVFKHDALCPVLWSFL